MSLYIQASSAAHKQVLLRVDDENGIGTTPVTKFSHRSTEYTGYLIQGVP